MISEAIERYAKKRRARVAIGLVKTNSAISESIRRAMSIADVLVVGSEIEGVECVCVGECADKEQAIARKMAELMSGGTIDAVVRGNIDYSYIESDYAMALGCKQIPRMALLKDVSGNEFAMTPASVLEGNSMKDRAEMAIKAVGIMCGMGLNVNVAVQRICDQRGLSEVIDQSIDESAYVAEMIAAAGYEVGYVGYGIENVMNKCNLLIPVNGIIGNAIWRTITGIGGCQDVGDLGMIDSVFIDDSKFWNDYYRPILCAVAIANRGL